MKILIGGVAIVLMAGIASADTLDYSNALSGQMTYLANGFNSLDPRATYATVDVTGSYSISLTYKGTTLTDYDISLVLSNGISATEIGSTSFLVPAYQTSTGANTCVSHSEIQGCINFLGSSAAIAFSTSHPQGNDWSVHTGQDGDYVSGDMRFCNGSGADYTATVEAPGVCSMSLGSSKSGTWTTVSAPEIGWDGSALTLFGLLVLLGGEQAARAKRKAA